MIVCEANNRECLNSADICTGCALRHRNRFVGLHSQLCYSGRDIGRCIPAENIALTAALDGSLYAVMLGRPLDDHDKWIKRHSQLRWPQPNRTNNPE